MQLRKVTEYQTIRDYAAERGVTSQAVYLAIKRGAVIVRDLGGQMVVRLDENAYRDF